MHTTTIDLNLVGTSLRLVLEGVDEIDRACLVSCYQRALATAAEGAAEIQLERSTELGWRASSSFGDSRSSDRIEDLVPLVDEQIVLALQRARPELLFLHAAVLEYEGRGVLLLAESGAGKSTTCLGLLESGLGFFSDELAPIDPASQTVASFPRALCLKAEPPAGFGDGVVEHRGRYYVSPAVADFGRLPIEALLFVRYDADRDEPKLDRLTPAEATLRLAAQGLNLLAHDDFALDLLSEVAVSTPAFHLDSAQLGPTCELVLAELAQL